MSITHAILGILSYKPMTGYELKKIMQDSPFMYWSGNNNQIYKVLVDLLNKGYATNEIKHQESSPSKKIYSITNDGLEELKKWSLSTPEITEIKSSFFIQLAWTGQLSNDELKQLLLNYEQEIKVKIITEQKNKEKGYFSPSRTKRETKIWEMIHQNILTSYENELKWINELKQEINQFKDEDYKNSPNNNNNKTNMEEKEMKYELIEKHNQKYIYLNSSEELIQNEQDGLDLISYCMSHGTNLLLIQGDRLSDDFLRLRTGIAGAILQKFTLYNIRAVVVIEKEKIHGKFNELISESNQGNMFRVYSSFEEAENWLLGMPDSLI